MQIWHYKHKLLMYIKSLTRPREILIGEFCNKLRRRQRDTVNFFCPTPKSLNLILHDKTSLFVF